MGGMCAAPSFVCYHACLWFSYRSLRLENVFLRGRLRLSEPATWFVRSVRYTHQHLSLHKCVMVLVSRTILVLGVREGRDVNPHLPNKAMQREGCVPLTNSDEFQMTTCRGSLFKIDSFTRESSIVHQSQWNACKVRLPIHSTQSRTDG